MQKKLYRSNNKMVCGVCAGVAEYFDIDPTIVRLGWVIGSLFAGCGVLVYIAATIIVPKQPQ